MGSSPSDPALDLGILGPVDARRDGRSLVPGGHRPRALLGLLVLHSGTVVSTARLIKGIWGEDAPRGASSTLHVHISNLRKVVGPGVIETRSPGYTLSTHGVRIDHVESETDLRRAAALRREGDLAGSRAAVAESLGHWRGAPLEDVSDAPFAAPAIGWLLERRALAVEERCDLDLLLGSHRRAVVDLEAAVVEWPYRERLWAQLMVALYRSGRQADALGAYQRARQVLADDLGVEPGPDLRGMERAVLDQDPGLDHPSGDAGLRPGRAPGWETTMPAWGEIATQIDLPDGTSRPITGLTVLGRGPDCDLVLTHGAVSRRHAEIRPTVAGLLLTDLGSTNGTLVNGVAVTRHVLQDGDELMVGDHTLSIASGPVER
ncbi:MAG: BTAD domain-containing putative transcriptional regulator [Iamia sp.]